MNGFENANEIEAETWGKLKMENERVMSSKEEPARVEDGKRWR